MHTPINSIFCEKCINDYWLTWSIKTIVVWYSTFLSRFIRNPERTKSSKDGYYKPLCKKWRKTEREKQRKEISYRNIMPYSNIFELIQGTIYVCSTVHVLHSDVSNKVKKEQLFIPFRLMRPFIQLPFFCFSSLLSTKSFKKERTLFLCWSYTWCWWHTEDKYRSRQLLLLSNDRFYMVFVRTFPL